MSREVALSEMLSALLTEVTLLTEHPEAQLLSEASLSLKVNVTEVRIDGERSDATSSLNAKARLPELLVIPSADAASSGNLTVRLKLHFTPQAMTQSDKTTPDAAETKHKAADATESKESGHA